jgi:hypothetical protein
MFVKDGAMMSYDCLDIIDVERRRDVRWEIVDVLG